MLNNITLHGRIAKDLDLRYTQSQKPVVSFPLAVDRGGQDKGVDFITCTAWNGTAETMCKYLHKGSEILVNGRLTINQWEDKNGSKHYDANVVVNTFDFCGSAKSNAESADAPTFEDMAEDGELPF